MTDAFVVDMKKLDGVLRGLDPDDDAQWDAKGKVLMVAVEGAYGDKRVTRKDVDASDSGFNRYKCRVRVEKANAESRLMRPAEAKHEATLNKPIAAGDVVFLSENMTATEVEERTKAMLANAVPDGPVLDSKSDFADWVNYAPEAKKHRDALRAAYELEEPEASVAIDDLKDFAEKAYEEAGEVLGNVTPSPENMTASFGAAHSEGIVLSLRNANGTYCVVSNCHPVDLMGNEGLIFEYRSLDMAHGSSQDTGFTDTHYARMLQLEHEALKRDLVVEPVHTKTPPAPVEPSTGPASVEVNPTDGYFSAQYVRETGETHVTEDYNANAYGAIVLEQRTRRIEKTLSIAAPL